MKKMLVSFSLIVSLMMVAAVPAFADYMGRAATNDSTMNNYDYRTNNTDNLGHEIGKDVRHGMNKAGRAINNGVVDVERATGMDTRMNANNYRTNNYRTNATTNDRDFNWGWLGLLGLIGLAGMRSRERDRT